MYIKWSVMTDGKPEAFCEAAGDMARDAAANFERLTGKQLRAPQFDFASMCWIEVFSRTYAPKNDKGDLHWFKRTENPDGR